jgi:hypothetical protein
MIGALLAILSPFRKVLAWAAAAAAVIGGAFLAGRRDAKQGQKIETLEAEAEAHERINQADTGIGATDADRVARLHDFAKRHGN